MIDRYAVQRIMEIIAYVMAERRAGTQLSQIDTDALHRLGYSDSEIAAALSWILERSQQGEPDTRISGAAPGSFRVLHDIEQDLITPEAWGLLLTLHDVGFLNTADLENILERAVIMGVERGIDVAEITSIVAVYLLAQSSSLGKGQKLYLEGTETIQ